MVFKHKLFV